MLAAGAGLASLAVCYGAGTAIVVLLILAMTFGAGGMSSILGLLGILTVIALACASFWLPARALGAEGSQAIVSAALSSLIFLAFIASFVFPVAGDDTSKKAFALLAFTTIPTMLTMAATWPRSATSDQFALTLIAATVAPYALSLLVAYSVPDLVYSYVYSCAVAGVSWLLLPALAAGISLAGQWRAE